VYAPHQPIVQRIPAPSPVAATAAPTHAAAPAGHDLAGMRVSPDGEGAPRSGLLARAFAGGLRDGEVRAERVPRVDLGAAQLRRVLAAARGAADPAARPVPDALRNGSARVAGDHLRVPALPVRDGASTDALVEAMRGVEARDAAVSIRGSRYTVRLRTNPWHHAVTGELLDPQPNVNGTPEHGERRTFGEHEAVWHEPGLRPPRSRRAPQTFDFEQVNERDRALRDQSRQQQEDRRREREEEQQRRRELADQGIAQDPDASWGVEQALTRAHRASRPDPKRWSQSVSSMHLPLMPDGTFGTPIVSQQRPMNITREHVEKYAEDQGLEEPSFLSQPQRHQHAEPTGQMDFLQQLALAYGEDREDEAPLLALEMSSRGRCDDCEENPEEMGLQGLIVNDPQRRLHARTPHWVTPKGFPTGFVDDDEIEPIRPKKGGIPGATKTIKRDRVTRTSDKRKKKKPRNRKPVFKSEHPFDKGGGPPPPPPGSGGIGGEILSY
jgi:hypothetical protein